MSVEYFCLKKENDVLYCDFCLFFVLFIACFGIIVFIIYFGNNAFGNIANDVNEVKFNVNIVAF